MLSKSLALLLLPTASLAGFNLLSLEDFPQMPEGQTENPACIAAYNATIECDIEIIQPSVDSDKIDEAWLNKVCKTECLDSLRKWVRGGPGCEGEAYLNYFGLLDDPNFFDGYPMTVADIQQYYITSTYHSRCTTDLNPQEGKSKYCFINAMKDEGEIWIGGYYNVSNPAAFCDVETNSCALQSAYLWSPVNVTYRYDESQLETTSDVPMISLKEACPNLDTKGFPVRESAVSETPVDDGTTGSPDQPDDNNGGNGGDNNNNNGGSNNKNTDGENNNDGGSGAGTAMVSLTVMFSSMLMAGALLL